MECATDRPNAASCWQDNRTAISTITPAYITLGQTLPWWAPVPGATLLAYRNTLAGPRIAVLPKTVAGVCPGDASVTKITRPRARDSRAYHTLVSICHGIALRFAQPV
jgi:hypothetical protein